MSCIIIAVFNCSNYYFECGFFNFRLVLWLLGGILRDSHGVAQVRFVTGSKILRILKAKGLAPSIPEDLYFLIKKAVSIRKHLERNRWVAWQEFRELFFLRVKQIMWIMCFLCNNHCRKDKDSKFRLILVESRIHRLARYYKTKRVLAPTWKYESNTASALVA